MTKGTFVTQHESLSASAEHMRYLIRKAWAGKITDLQRQADKTVRTSYLTIYNMLLKNAENGIGQTELFVDNFLTREEREGFANLLTTLGYRVAESKDAKLFIINV